MSHFTKNKDTDREILNKLDDKTLLKACIIDKYTWETVCDDEFFHRRIIEKYSEIIPFKNENESWKHFFLRAITYISLMKEKFKIILDDDFIKTKQRNPIYYTILFKEYQDNINKILIKSSELGELKFVKWSLKVGADIHAKDDEALSWASSNGDLEVVKFLVEHGADIHILNDYPLRFASRNGHLEVVKYLVEHGANIHAINDQALRWASSLDIVKYLMERGADKELYNKLYPK